MSKTTQENKAKIKKKAKLAVEDQVIDQKAPETETVVTETTPVEETTESVVKKARARGKKYQTARKLVDVNKLYSLKEAVELVKKTSLSKFDGKVEAHLTVFDIGNVGEISFPHLEVGTKRIVLLNDAILAEIKEGKINFDILIATPVTMPKLLPYARILGPKGLMPNPKNGTLTDKPQDSIKKLSVAKTIIKTEKKVPVIHQIVGKVSQDSQELIANIEELIKVIKSPKIKKMVLCATMGPGIKVEVK